MEKKIRLLHQFISAKWLDKSLKLYGVFIRKLIKNTKDIQYICIGENKSAFKSVVNVKLPFIDVQITLYEATFPLETFKVDTVFSPVKVSNGDSKSAISRSITYNFLGHRDLLMARSKIHKDNGLNISRFIKQGGGNTLLFVEREPNVTDSFHERLKIAIAFILSNMTFFYKTIVLFEKKSEGFEESSSVLYKKLIDLGYKNVFFILGKEKEKLYEIQEVYRENIVRKYSFKHYFVYFSAKLYLATETPFHGLELRTISRFVHWYLKYYKRYKYVFLQHGVMLMVSLDSKTRKDFRKGSWISEHGKIVVSSKAEADHFVTLGGYKYEDLLITGLPKFDNAYKLEGASNIVVMPTWMPWEETLAQNNPKETLYYKMLVDILKSVPISMQKDVRILPHPLISQQLRNTPLKKYIPEIFSYDIELRNAALLITDYSSIAFDAFYRGIPVIFWWKHLEETEKYYGTSLMLNHSNAFGDICYSSKELGDSISRNYMEKPIQKYYESYSSLIDFTEGGNTERLIEKLRDIKYL